MVHPQEKTLTLKPATAAEILPFVERAARFDTTQGGADLQAIAENGQRFVLCDGEQAIFGYTLETDRDEVTITAAAGRSALDLTAGGLQIIEAQAQGFAHVTFHTIRRGLVKKAARLGYQVAQTIDSHPPVYIMRKGIQ